MIYKGKNYIIKEEFGLLKKGMCCYCFDEGRSYVRLWFQTPIIGDTCEVKLPKDKAYILKER